MLNRDLGHLAGLLDATLENSSVLPALRLHTRVYSGLDDHSLLCQSHTLPISLVQCGGAGRNQVLLDEHHVCSDGNAPVRELLVIVIVGRLPGS